MNHRAQSQYFSKQLKTNRNAHLFGTSEKAGWKPSLIYWGGGLAFSNGAPPPSQRPEQMKTDKWEHRF